MAEGGLLEKNRVKTLTFDNGKGFAGHELIEHLNISTSTPTWPGHLPVGSLAAMKTLAAGCANRFRKTEHTARSKMRKLE